MHDNTNNGHKAFEMNIWLKLKSLTAKQCVEIAVIVCNRYVIVRESL